MFRITRSVVGWLGEYPPYGGVRLRADKLLILNLNYSMERGVKEV